MSEFGRARVVGTIALLTVANIVNVMDRSLLAVLADPIKHSLDLTDFRVGLLAGMSFFIVYCLLAVPLSRIADRGMYRLVIAGSLVVWSTMTTLGGLAQSFWQLAFARFGVASGEAGLQPASHALISKLVSPQRRGLAIATFSLGVPLGGAAGAALAGLLVDRYDWRVAFLSIGPIGIVLLPIMLSVLPRVPRQPITEKLSLFQTAQLLFSNPIYKRLWLGYAIVTMFGYSVSAFFGPFFMRSHGLTGTEVGATFGAVNIVLGTAGVFLGGFLHDWANELLPGSGLYPATAGLLISIVLALIGFLSPNLKISIIGVAGAIFLYFFILGPTMTLAQSLSPPPLRAYSSALMGVSAGLVGASGGPAIAGLLSDLLSSWAQGDALRYALAGMTAFEMIGMALYCQVSRRMVSAARKERISATSPMCKVGLLETVQSNGQSSPGYH